CFDDVRDPAQTPKFFLHWYWRVHAHVGATRAWLVTGDLARARSEAHQLTRVALSTADPNLHALAWETRAQVAIVEMDWPDAKESTDSARGALAGPEAPTAAWQVHGAASEWYRKTGRRDTAAAHHARAVEHLDTLLDSFEPDEPIRQALRAA